MIISDIHSLVCIMCDQAPVTPLYVKVEDETFTVKVLSYREARVLAQWARELLFVEVMIKRAPNDGWLVIGDYQEI